MKKLINNCYKAITLSVSAVFLLASCAVKPSVNNHPPTLSDNVNKEDNNLDDDKNKKPSVVKPDYEQTENLKDTQQQAPPDENTNETDTEQNTDKKDINTPPDDKVDKNVTPPKKDEKPNKYTSANPNMVDIITKRDSKYSAEWEIVDNVAKAGQEFYNDFFSNSKIITKNGFLFSYSNNREIDVKYLVERDYISNKYLTSECKLLLVLSDDVKAFDNVSVNGKEKGLTIFAVVKTHDNNGYVIASSSSVGGVITDAQYESLISKYSQNHGNILRAYPNSNEYTRIISFINMYEGKFDTYFVRNITLDNKYAMVVLSPQNDSGALKQYILKKSGEIWEVVFAGLEKEPRPIVAVNKAIPDFNTEILPAWSIYDYKDTINKYKNDVLILMSQIGIISGSADIDYICGATNYYYIVLKNQIKYIAHYNGRTWDYVNVLSNYDAEKELLGYGNVVPMFIILDR